MTIAIIDYGSGNLRSAEKAVERALSERGSSREIMVTSSPDQVRKADHIILPGVGAFGDCIKGLRDLPDMVDCLEERVINDGQPLLGICIGMQLLARSGHEHGIHQGLDWIGGEVRPLEPVGNLKIPHMGWNEIGINDPFRPHPLLEGINDGEHMYFVHSYHFDVDDPGHVMAGTDYGGSIAAMVLRDNIVGCQFHPEKSQQSGVRLMGNFLNWTP